VAKVAQSDYRERVYKIVRKIPRGRVMTYGQIAELLGDGYTPRTVGFVMHASPSGTPWHRVLNAKGACSTGRVVLPHDKQQRMLEMEKVVFDKSARCDLQTFLWIPKDGELAERPSRNKATLFKKKPATKGVKR
jgi:methylated-DNA-protein-cysteine methyltransferase related protein